MLKPDTMKSTGYTTNRPNNWKHVIENVRKSQNFKKGCTQMETFGRSCSFDTKKQLSRNSSTLRVLKRAAFYTKPSQQSDSLPSLPTLNSKPRQLAPLTGRAPRTASLEGNEKVIQRRLRRKKSTVPAHGLSHHGSNVHISVTPHVLSEEVSTYLCNTSRIE